MISFTAMVWIGFLALIAAVVSLDLGGFSSRAACHYAARGPRVDRGMDYTRAGF